MLTSHCQHCGAPKSQNTWANNYCTECQTVLDETREYVVKENAARVAVEESNRKIITEKAEELKSGKLTAEAAGLKSVQPIIDLSQALKDALLRRAHTTNSSHADPRTVFDPGLSNANMANLGMPAKIAPNSNITQA